MASNSRRMRLGLLLVCVLLGVYLLIYDNRTQSVDGSSIVSVASATIQHGSPDMFSIGHTEWFLLPLSRLGSTGTNGVLYSKKGSFPAIALLPLVIIAHIIPGFSITPTAMLFNPIITVATALLVFNFVRLLGYQPSSAFVTALLFGLFTTAVFYVKTLYGEPLAGLLLLIATHQSYCFREHGSNRHLGFVGASLSLAIGVNNIYALFVPLFAVYLFWPVKFNRRTLRHGLVFAAPLVCVLVLLGVFNALRFGNVLDSGYHFAEGEQFNRPILTGLYGLFLSPFRGLFWYSPILLLALPGLLIMRRHHARLVWLVIGVVMLQAIAFASWWSWHGGVTWGPRFLIPIIPVMSVVIAPVVEAAAIRWPIRASILFLASVSLVVQLAAVLYRISIYYGYLDLHYGTSIMNSTISGLADEVLYRVKLSPIVGHLVLLWGRHRPQLEWLSNNDVDLPHLTAALFLILFGLLVWWLEHHWLTSRRLILSGAVVSIMMTSVIVLRQQEKPIYARIDALEQVLRPPATVVAATTLFDDGLVDVDNGSRVISMNAPTAPEDARARQFWQYAQTQGDRLWYLTWFERAAETNWQERELWQTRAFVKESLVANHRALLFSLAPSPALDRAVGWRFESIQFDSAGISVGDEGVIVSLGWSAEMPTDQPYSWFVHLIDENHNIVAQQDRQPQGGYAPTTQWTPNETIIDRLFLPLDADIDVSGWHIRIGFIDPMTGERIPAIAPDGERSPSDFVLLPVNE